MIKLFRGTYEYLSNFYDPCPVTYDGLTYRNSEAAYQAAKCADPERKREFCDISPQMAKRLGGHVQLREDWNRIRENVMREVIHAKFEQHPELADMLLSTGRQKLVEGNYWHDNFFGDCQCLLCRKLPGKNALGTILMEERQRLRKEGKQHG